MDKFEKIKNTFGLKVRVNEPMKKHTTLKMGGPANIFLKVKKEKDLTKIVTIANNLNIPFIVIGEGSNLLVDEKGYKGLVIKNSIHGIKQTGRQVRVKSGTNLQTLIDYLVSRGLKGMEKMSGIPGTVGGAIYGNAGAYGQEISDCLTRVKVFEGKDTKWYPKKDCYFKYRESIFKNNNLAILEAEFKLKKSNTDKLSKKAKEILDLRLIKYPKHMMCAGSFYKNMQVKNVSTKIISKIPSDKIIFGKIPTGYLMEAVGANGKRRGDIEIAKYHGNLFINKGKGRATDFYNLANYYKKRVKKKFGIELEPEVQLIGFK